MINWQLIHGPTIIATRSHFNRESRQEERSIEILILLLVAVDEIRFNVYFAECV